MAARSEPSTAPLRSPGGAAAGRRGTRSATRSQYGSIRSLSAVEQTLRLHQDARRPAADQATAFEGLRLRKRPAKPLVEEG